MINRFHHHYRSCCVTRMPDSESFVEYQPFFFPGDGSFYSGELWNGMKHGFGVHYNLEGGITYEGYWVCDKPHGEGRLTTPDIIFTGQFKYGEKDGLGTLIINGFTLYEGEWKEGRMTKGKRYREDGATYYGQVLPSSLEHGYGVVTWENNDKYEGFWREGRPHGYGRFIVGASKTVLYSGQLEDGERSGTGVSTEENGERYEGEWQKNMKHGFGELFVPGKYKYIGLWKNNMKEGEGRAQWVKENITYEGQWKNDMKEGEGREQWVEKGIKYEGQWKASKPEGQGIWTTSNGDKYSGEWRNGVLEGTGKLIREGNMIYDSYWKDGKPDRSGTLNEKRNTID